MIWLDVAPLRGAGGLPRHLSLQQLSSIPFTTGKLSSVSSETPQMPWPDDAGWAVTPSWAKSTYDFRGGSLNFFSSRLSAISFWDVDEDFLPIF